ncbi:hypothetical protein DMB65_03435 [Flavobacterium cheongpyeongense]|uniref:Uncharacterized protein n=1 Tax=Flavobacterium cheongpyeongense TaxID=2212651 RepID=A0A2V4BWQ2_9FLAO|nr:hypothetical protein [Flavobacterium cheongpyeongense]PXY42293.1 hypothetical protein DMB65_03435 [Flavobacterium cheongpyeongense]
MENFEKLLEVFKEKCDSSVFEPLISEQSLEFFKKIVNRIQNNYINENEISYRENTNLLIILFQQYPASNENVELFLADSLIKNFRTLINRIFNNKIEENGFLESPLAKNLIIFIDIFFHNPYFSKIINDFEKEFFLNDLVSLTKIKYNPEKDFDIQLSIQNSVSVFFYFPESMIQKNKIFYKNHFDESVVSEFEELDAE